MKLHKHKLEIDHEIFSLVILLSRRFKKGTCQFLNVRRTDLALRVSLSRKSPVR